MRSIIILYKVIKKIYFKIDYYKCWFLVRLKLKLNNVKFGIGLIAYGVPIINVNLLGKFKIGNNIRIHSGKYYNMIGRQQKTYFIVGSNAVLVIGDNVGISSSAIICNCNIKIEDNVKIGGNVVIYDSDFHSLNYRERNSIPENFSNVILMPVLIKEGVFIGSHSTILKGVTIGENSIIGACSVVTLNIPPNQIWAGNPIKYIRDII